MRNSSKLELLLTKLGKNFVILKSMTSKVRLACIAGGGVGVLYCFGGGAVRRVGVQVNLKSRTKVGEQKDYQKNIFAFPL